MPFTSFFLFPYFFGCITFLVDGASLFFFGNYLLTTTLSYYLMYTATHTKFLVMTFLMTLIGLLSFLQYGIFGLDLLYLIPITAGVLTLRNFLHTTRLLAILLLICCLTIKIGVIEQYYLGQSASIDFTIRKFFVNLIILIGMSLTLNPKGNLGNRL